MVQDGAGREKLPLHCLSWHFQCLAPLSGGIKMGVSLRSLKIGNPGFLQSQGRDTRGQSGCPCWRWEEQVREVTRLTNYLNSAGDGSACSPEVRDEAPLNDLWGVLL